MGPLLTLQEVAAELKVSVRGVLGFISRGELRAIEGLGRGRGFRVRREWLEAFLRAREVAVPSPAATPGIRLPPPARAPQAPFRSVQDARAALGLIRGGRS